MITYKILSSVQNPFLCTQFLLNFFKFISSFLYKIGSPENFFSSWPVSYCFSTSNSEQKFDQSWELFKKPKACKVFRIIKRFLKGGPDLTTAIFKRVSQSGACPIWIHFLRSDIESVVCTVFWGGHIGRFGWKYGKTASGVFL